MRSDAQQLVGALAEIAYEVEGGLRMELAWLWRDRRSKVGWWKCVWPASIAVHIRLENSKVH